MQYFDTIIVGQGLAGTALAWQLEFAGRNFLIIDREPHVTSSRIAAGLVTPITGQRLVKAERFEEYFREAEAFYRQVEAGLDAIATPHPPMPLRGISSTSPTGGEVGVVGVGAMRQSRPDSNTSPPVGEVDGRAERERREGGRVFHASPMLRLFRNDRERSIFEAKQHSEFARLVESHPSIDPALVAPLGGFTMIPAARLEAERYLNLSREYFRQSGRYLHADVSMDAVELDSDGVRIPSLDLCANRIIFCQGFLNTPNPYFATIPFQAAQGDILTLRIPGFRETRVIHAEGIWLAPASSTSPLVGEVDSRSESGGGEALYRCGSTYSWEPFDGLPSAAGRVELELKLQSFLKLPFEVVNHQAAVRPIIRESRPRIGMHPQHPQLGYFNGLGSKGSLLAPHFARKLAEHLFEGTPLDPATDVRGLLG